MGISRAGYYKWLNRPKTNRDIKREKLVKLVDEVHKAHLTDGYRWTAVYIRINYEYSFSYNYIYKCFKYLGIKAETRHKLKRVKRKESAKNKDMSTFIDNYMPAIDKPCRHGNDYIPHINRIYKRYDERKSS